MPQLGVIVPIFGVEKYIERCARSLFAQTMSDIEFIFVNDCTQDSSMTILKRIIDDFPNRNVKIINHERNLGLPAARRTGIENAKGEYILHCDSDDWLESNCCELAYETAKKTDADVVVYKNWIDIDDSCIEDNTYDDSYLKIKDKALSAAISLKSSPYMWNKLVRRKIYDNPILYPNNNLAEDWVMSVQYAYYSKKTVCVDNRLYHYCVNKNSIMRTETKEACYKRCADEYANVTLVCEWLKEKELLQKYKYEIVTRKAVTKHQLDPIINDVQARKLWRKIFPEINIPVILGCNFDRHSRIQYLLLTTGLYMPYKYLRSKLHI